MRQQFNTVLAQLQAGEWARADGSPRAAGDTPPLQVSKLASRKCRVQTAVVMLANAFEFRSLVLHVSLGSLGLHLGSSDAQRLQYI